MDIKSHCASCGTKLFDDDEIGYESYDVFCLDCMQHPTYGEKCYRCPMLVKSRTNITTGYGNRARGLYFVGEAPGRYGCDKTGIPFKGDRSGDYFMKALKKIGVSYKNAYFTNTIKCCPPENRTPTIEEISACNEMLMNEIKTAKLIVCVGGIAYTAITKRRAFVLRDTLKLFDNKIVIPHPSFILRLRKQKWYEQEILPALKTNISEKTTVFSKK